MVQVQSIQHVNTEQVIEDLRKIGILVTELQVDIGVDRVTSVIVNGHYIGYCAENEYAPITDVYRTGGIADDMGHTVKV